MADESLYDLAEKEEQTKEIADEDEVYKQMKVVSLEERKRAKCESCVRDKCSWSGVSSWSDVSSPSDVSSWSEWLERERQRLERKSQRLERERELYERVAVFLCFVCEVYVCAECLAKHRGHEGIKLGRKENEGMKEQRERERNEVLGKKSRRMRVEAESERERKREKKESDIERMRERLHAKKLWDDVMNESETGSEEMFKTNKVSNIERVKVKHEFDLEEHCDITGLCGLENKRLVVCDFSNCCIKIFKLGKHVLQRYIRFVGSGPFGRLVGPGPWEVTEIDLKQNKLVSDSSSAISVTGRADPDKQCLIAVTLPEKHQIMFIDLSKNPAKRQKVIQTEGACVNIQFNDDIIFTVCEEGPGNSPCSVHIYSTDGITLNKFNTGLYGYFSDPYLAVVSGRVYITDKYNSKVQCRNVGGQLISEITFEGSEPRGTSVDPDNNVYVCAWRKDKVYKLDADLTRYKSVLDQTTCYIEKPYALCYYRDKLFISHYGPPSLQNFVTVIRLL